MARKYIHELVGWPEFAWDSKTLAPLLSEVRLHQGLLLGKMRGYGFASQWTATLRVLTEETIKSSAIEGVVLSHYLQGSVGYSVRHSASDEDAIISRSQRQR